MATDHALGRYAYVGDSLNKSAALRTKVPLFRGVGCLIGREGELTIE